jgi:hypothetical protein
VLSVALVAPSAWSGGRRADKLGGVPARSPRFALLENREWLRSRREAGWSVARIRSELGTSTAAVRAAIAAAGLPPELPRPGPSYPELYDVAWMRAKLEHSTVTEIARRLGCSTRSVKNAARRAGVPGRRRMPRPTQLADRSWLEAQLQQGRAYSDIADALGCSVKAVGRAVREHGLNGLARRRRRFPELHDADWLRRALATQTPAQVAATLGCSVEAVRAAQRRA